MFRKRLAILAKGYITSIVIWSALSLLTGWNYLIFDKAANLHSTLSAMILLAEGRGLAYALLAPPLFYLVNRFSHSKGIRVRYFMVCALGVIPYLVVYSCVRWVICPPWNPNPGEFVSRGSSSPLEFVQSGFADIFSMYLATLLAAHAYYYFDRVRNQELERSEYQQALATSELQALKMQIHPHFLFNTLHGISTLIASDGKSAQSMILKLSNLLRTSLEHTGSDVVPLHDELRFIREYLDIEQMRFRSRLSVTWLIDSGTLKFLVPQLILQPLVENAVRHGIASSRVNGWIEISAQSGERALYICVRNSVGVEMPRGTGVGLRNTKARLRHFYSDEAAFSFLVEPGHTATAALVLPGFRSQSQFSVEAPNQGRTLEPREAHARTDR